MSISFLVESIYCNSKIACHSMKRSACSLKTPLIMEVKCIGPLSNHPGTISVSDGVHKTAHQLSREECHTILADGLMRHMFAKEMRVVNARSEHSKSRPRQPISLMEFDL